MTEFENNTIENQPIEGDNQDERIQDEHLEGKQQSSEEDGWLSKGQDDGLQDEGREDVERQDEDGRKNDEVQQKDDVEKNHFAALKQERYKRQQIERQLKENAQKMQRMEEMFSKLNEAPQRAEEEIPSYDEDPLAHLSAKNKKFEEYLNKQKQSEQVQQQQIQQQQKLQSVVSDYQNKAKEFMQEQPDFQDAYSYLLENRRKQYEAAGYNQQDVQSLIAEDELSVVANSYQNGQNPAELMYNIAKASGYKSEQKQSDSLNQVRRGMESNKSLSNKGGRTNSTPMTLEQLANMDPGDERFDRYWKQLTGSKA